MLALLALPVHAQLSKPSSLSLEAKEVATAVNTQHHWKTDYGSYDRDQQKRTAIEVTVRDFSRKSPPSIARVYFIGRPLRGGNRFIYAQRDLPITFNGNIDVTVRVDAPNLNSSVLNLAALRERYVSGAEIEGWVVVGEMNGQAFQAKASRQPLLDLLLRRNHPESLPAMIAEYDKAKR